MRASRHSQRVHCCHPPVATTRRRFSAQRHIQVQANSEAADAVAAVASSPQVTELPTRLNGTPHPREMRRFFYSDAADSVLRALAAESRVTLRCTIPELNPEMDVWRVGTLLELVREVATRVAEDGRLVKVCVQGSMGQGVFQGLPLSLSGVARIMKMMDWGEVAEQVTFGEVSAEDAEGDADVFLLIAPQNIVGNTIMTNLSDMVEAVEEKKKAMVLINPQLKDMPSHSGIMGVRGREGRLQLAESFVPAYHFRLLYYSGSYYPIMGAMRYEYGGKWQVYKRVDLSRKDEEYKLWGEFAAEPSGGEITAELKQTVPLLLRGKVPEDKKRKDGKWW
eukprot:jgi/Ulvmu1/755/UM010_0129.1